MQTFTKAERLLSKSEIERLYSHGKSFYSYPFKIYLQETLEGSAPVKILITVPKRMYKRAVDRNKIKRLIREAYRKNKNVLIEALNQKPLHVMFIYTSKTIEPYCIVEQKLLSAMKKIINEA